MYFKTDYEKELKNLTKGTIIVGSVNDPYQKIEDQYLITRELLKLIKKTCKFSFLFFLSFS